MLISPYVIYVFSKIIFKKLIDICKIKEERGKNNSNNNYSILHAN